MSKLRALALLGLLGGALPACGGGGGTFVLVRIERGSAVGDIASIDLQLALDGQMVTLPLAKMDGMPLALPTSKTLEIGSASGRLDVVAVAFDGSRNVVSRGSNSGTVTRGDTTTIVVTLGMEVQPPDASVPDTGMPDDGGIDGASVDAAGATLSLDRMTQMFGDVEVNTMTGAVTVTVTNTGGTTAGPIDVALSGSNASQFMLSNDMCATKMLAPSASCTVGVLAAPTATGPAVATLTVSASPGGAPTVALSANVVPPGQLEIIPSARDFGTVAVGALPAGVDFTVRNRGGATLPAAPVIALAGNDRTDFAILTNSCTVALAPNATCTVNLRFAPRSVGSKLATLSAMGGGTSLAQLSGTANAQLTVSTGGNGAGSVTSAPAGVTCPGSCTGTFVSSPVSLTATPSMGSSFGGWGGACTGGAGCSVTLDAASKTVSATFTLQQFVLTAARNGTGGGTIMGAGINCPGTCTGSFDYNSPVTLTAAANASSNFVRWTGCNSVNGAMCMVTVDAMKTVTATFDVKTWLLTVNKAGTGMGTVMGGGINCGATCMVTLNDATPVALVATASGGSMFRSWSGCDSTSGMTCNVTMTSAKTVTVTFDPQQNCMASSPSVLHFVDHALGTDDTMHGGASGACAYRTLTYALTQAQGQIALAFEEYSPATGETLPFVLTGTQSLACNYLTAGKATLKGKGNWAAIGSSVTVGYSGTANQLYSCKIDGGGGTGYCAYVNSQSSSPTSGHLFSQVDFTSCGGFAVQVGNNFGNVNFSSGTFNVTSGNTLGGIFLVGTNAGTRINNNVFTGTNAGVQCQNANSMVTGSGNTMSSCVTCGNCPF